MVVQCKVSTCPIMLVISLSTSQTFEVGQVPAEDPTCGETSIEQQLLWVEGEVVSEVLAGQVQHLDCALFSQDYPVGEPDRVCSSRTEIELPRTILL